MAERHAVLRRPPPASLERLRTGQAVPRPGRARAARFSTVRAWWRAHGRATLWLLWALLVTVALATGWVTARGSLGVRLLACLGALAMLLYVHARLRERR